MPIPSSTPSQAISIANLLNHIFDGHTLSRQEAHEVIGHLMDGKLSQIQAASLLAALRTRGETVEEIIGFAEAMRERSIKVNVTLNEPLLDIVGTGGTGINTFNISTASMFVIAAGGARVAKHGNRGVTRKSGSADVLEALGINLNLSPEALAKALHELSLAFIYARSHHPAMKFVAPIRADIQARTIFNSLGPLTNPARAQRQLMGCYSPKLTENFAQVLAGLGIEHGMVVHSMGLDELSVCGPNIISELKGNEVHTYELAPDELGLSTYPLDDVLGGTPQENAETILGVLAGKIGEAKRAVICLNAGAGLYLADKAPNLKAGIGLAQELIDSGKALEKLEAYKTFSQIS